MRTADTADEWLKLLADKSNFVLRSAGEFRAFVLEGKPAGDLDSSEINLVKTLKALPPRIIEEFIDRLRFRDGGLAGADYRMLSGYMKENDIENIFRFFGIGAKLLRGYKDYYCEGPGTCSGCVQSICTDKC